MIVMGDIIHFLLASQGKVQTSANTSCHMWSNHCWPSCGQTEEKDILAVTHRYSEGLIIGHLLVRVGNLNPKCLPELPYNSHGYFSLTASSPEPYISIYSYTTVISFQAQNFTFPAEGTLTV